MVLLLVVGMLVKRGVRNGAGPRYVLVPKREGGFWTSTGLRDRRSARAARGVGFRGGSCMERLGAGKHGSMEHGAVGAEKRGTK
jgi:hypothetical protein